MPRITQLPGFSPSPSNCSPHSLTAWVHLWIQRPASFDWTFSFQRNICFNHQHIFPTLPATQPSGIQSILFVSKLEFILKQFFPPPRTVANANNVMYMYPQLSLVTPLAIVSPQQPALSRDPKSYRVALDTGILSRERFYFAQKRQSPALSLG